MVDDDEAFDRWEERFWFHVDLIVKERGGEQSEEAVARAMAQAYHEGIEGLRKRGH